MPGYDAIVAGAGPGGAATAALLARGGATVLLVDRSVFPRDKACGGGLTPRGVAAAERVGVDTTDPAFVRVGGVGMWGDGRSSASAFPETTRWPSHGVVARRADLDQLVLDEALRAGAEFRPGVRVLGPVVEDGVCRGVRVVSNGSRDEWLADHTIAADGATSVLARGMGLGPRSGTGGFWYTALRSYMGPVEPRVGSGGPLLEFYPLRTADGRWLPAYGWVFPLPGGVANVGVDLPHRPALRGCPHPRKAYDAFVQRMRQERPGFADASEEAAPVGALLPEAMAGFRPAATGLLCVGDAAGMIVPYSGEGIVYALESAEHAAAAVLGSRRPSEVAASYEAVLDDAYGFHFRTSLAIMKAMRRPALARVAATLGIGRDRAFRAAVRVMAYLIDPDAGSSVSKGYLAAERAVRRGVRRART